MKDIPQFLGAFKTNLITVSEKIDFHSQLMMLSFFAGDMIPMETTSDTKNETMDQMTQTSVTAVCFILVFHDWFETNNTFLSICEIK